MKKKMHTGVRALGSVRMPIYAPRGGGCYLGSNILSAEKEGESVICVPRAVPGIQQVPTIWYLLTEFMSVLLYTSKHVASHSLRPAHLRSKKETESQTLRLPHLTLRRAPTRSAKVYFIFHK